MQDTPTPPRAPLERPIVRAAVGGVLIAAMIGIALAVQWNRGGGAGSSAADDPHTPTAIEENQAGLGALDSNPPLVGQPAPDFALHDSDGRVVRLSDLRGQVVWINFWATWCVPCKKELPDIEKIYQEKRDQGLRVLAINWQESRDTATAFFDARGLTLTLLRDANGDVYNQYRLQGLPDSFFIDRAGNIAAFQYGSLTEAKMRERLRTAGID